MTLGWSRFVSYVDPTMKVESNYIQRDACEVTAQHDMQIRGHYWMQINKLTS